MGKSQASLLNKRHFFKNYEKGLLGDIRDHATGTFDLFVCTSTVSNNWSWNFGKRVSLGELQKHQKPLCATQCKIISWTGLSKTTGALYVDPLIWLIEETNQQTRPESGLVPSQNNALNYVTVSVLNVFSLQISGHFPCNTTTVSPKVTTTAGSLLPKHNTETAMCPSYLDMFIFNIVSTSLLQGSCQLYISAHFSRRIVDSFSLIFRSFCRTALIALAQSSGYKRRFSKL